MMTCIKCKQEFSEENHECLDVMGYEELMTTASEIVESDLIKNLGSLAGCVVTPQSIASVKETMVECLVKHNRRHGLTEVDFAGIVDKAFDKVFKDAGFEV